MTAADKVPFVQAFNRLAVACQLPSKDADAAMHRVYFTGLEDLELGAVSAAADALARTAKFFPRVAEWREATRIAAVAHIKALPPGRDVPWEDECGACGDSGWEERTCYRGTRNTCGRKKCEGLEGEHRYVTACMCRPTNRTYARHHLGHHAVYAE